MATVGRIENVGMVDGALLPLTHAVITGTFAGAACFGISSAIGVDGHLVTVLTVSGGSISALFQWWHSIGVVHTAKLAVANALNQQTNVNAYNQDIPAVVQHTLTIDSPKQGWFFGEIPGGYNKLVKMAKFIQYEGGSWNHKALTGNEGIYRNGEYYQLQSKLLKNKFLAWKNPDFPNAGLRWTKPLGELLLKELACQPDNVEDNPNYYPPPMMMRLVKK